MFASVGGIEATASPHRITAEMPDTVYGSRREARRQMREMVREMITGPDTLSADSVAMPAADTVAPESLTADTLSPAKSFLPDVVTGSSKDSIVYDLKHNLIYIYNDGQVNFQDKSLTADFIKMDVEGDLISAYGSVDTTTGQYKKPVFKEGETAYDMDSIIYNTKTEMSTIHGVLTKEGEGTLRARKIKKADDEIYNIAGGTFTTCDADHPHFYLAMTKAQYVNGKNTKKMIIGPSYIVLEDVPLPIGVPFGFFPMISSRNSGVIIPTVGEENIKGFYLRNGGYY
ncbi:MAG: LPS-assembly protein LptD, partial [Rikenellaceae bacterium]|nr:LPS-assembly protein LptD [Rikenellaceae bacterium]